jgi:C-terminal processing protease CtpA/Prc
MSLIVGRLSESIYLKKNEHTIVTSVDPGSPGEISGIAVSDELLSIAEESIVGKSIPEVVWLLREKADKNGKLDLAFQRDGIKRYISVKIRD